MTYDSNDRNYFIEQGLDALIPLEGRERSFSFVDHLAADANDPFPPELDDLVRLHRLVRQRRVFTVLEFGVGYSTLVMSHALERNKADFEALEVKPRIRNSNMFRIFSLDSNETWIEETKKHFPEALLPFVEFARSPVHVGSFNGQICHFFDRIPNVVPDFIYLDGPHTKDIQGDFRGLDFQLPERTVMAGDLLAMEPVFVPGMMIVADGRSNNVRFLHNNFRRTYDYHFDPDKEYSTLELVEDPLGRINRPQIDYCLGDDYYRRVADAADN